MEICVAFDAVTVRTAEPSEEIEAGLAFKVTRTTGLPDIPEPHPLNINSGNRKTIHFAFTKARQLRTAPHDSSTAILLFHWERNVPQTITEIQPRNPKSPAISHVACIFVMHAAKEPVLDSHSSLSKVRPQAVQRFAPVHRGAARPALPGQHSHR